MDIRPALANIELALTKAEELSELAKEASGALLAVVIGELKEILLEAKRQCLAVQQGVSELEELLASRDQLFKERGMYWRVIGDKKVGGPFCSRCCEDRSELIHLDYHPGAIGHHPQSPFYECRHCGQRFEP